MKTAIGDGVDLRIGDGEAQTVRLCAPRAVLLVEENEPTIHALFGVGIAELKAWGRKGCRGVKALPAARIQGTRYVCHVDQVDEWLQGLPTMADALSERSGSQFDVYTRTANLPADTTQLPAPRSRAKRGDRG